MKVILCCSSGMSTSILARRTKEAAVRKSFSLTIEAFDSALAERKLDQADLVLIGPHLNYQLETLRKLAPASTRIELIDKGIYQSFDGNQLLNQIISYGLEIKKPEDNKPCEIQEENEGKGWTNQSHFKSFFTQEMLEVLRWKR